MKTNNEEKTRTPYTFPGYYEGDIFTAQHETQSEARYYLEKATELHNAIISGGDTIEERRRKAKEAEEALRMYAHSLARAQKDEEDKYLDLEYAALEEAQYAKLEAQYEGYEL